MLRKLVVPIVMLGIGHAADAVACGGFFCSQTPVLQTAERIIFEIDGDVITAYIQLQYQGNDPSFAWIVPVPEAPEVEVGVGQQMFSSLETQTKPIFVRTSSASSDSVPAAQALDVVDCGGGFSSGGGGGFSGSFGEPSLTLRYIPVPDVDVWQNERVGPYEVVTLSADNAEDLNNWLRANGYRVVQGSDPIVQQYLDDGMKLLALKLSPSADANAIEPIKLTYHDSRGCAVIPVKLTAIASVPNLEIVTWVFAESRAGARNFAVVDIPNDNLFDESDWVVEMEKTVESAGGRAFVTEYASKTEDLLAYGDPNLEALIQKHGYVTRLRTLIDPEEMTDDPEFEANAEGGDVARERTLRSPIPMGTGVFVLLALVAIRIVRRKS
jgi:hypothetical protein